MWLSLLNKLYLVLAQGNTPALAILNKNEVKVLETLAQGMLGFSNSFVDFLS